MSKVRVIFLGTPEFAAECLKAVIADEHYEVVGVVTQPDRPAGRKMLLTPSPVKSLALARGLAVISPDSINQEVMLQEIQKWGAEVAIVVAFGQILSQKFLDLFRFGAVNVHGSLLPKWRGAAPIQRSLEAGESETGVALQKVVKALDAGDILGVRKMQVGPEMNATEVFSRLAVLGADLLKVELMDYVRGNLVAIPQEAQLATYAKKIDKSESELDFKKSAWTLHNKIRAFSMGPQTFSMFLGKKIKIHKTRVLESEKSGLPPGRVIDVTADGVQVSTGEGVLLLIEVQPESRNRMRATDWARSVDIKEGMFS